MSSAAVAGGGAAAAAAAAAQAIKASGAIVRLEPEALRRLIEAQENPLVVVSTTWAFGTQHRYLTPYRGLVFYAQSREPIHVSSRAEVIHAKKMWMPG